MLCDKCHKREAKIYCTEIINGEKKEQSLCEECASEYTSFQMDKTMYNKEISIGGLLSSILGNYYVNQPAIEEKKIPMIKCKECGMTYETFLQGGKFGCSHCYKSFGKVLEKSLKQIHGAEFHVGKRPKGYLSATDQIVKGLSALERLSIKLQDAIEKEEFEEAARLRDVIKELKKEEIENA